MRQLPVASALLFICLTVLLTTPVYGQVSDSPGSVNCPPPVNLTVTVTTEGGAVIPNAFVILREDTLGQPRGVKAFESELRTEENGEASAAIPCNYLDVFVGANGFAPTAQKFLITRDAHAFSVPLKMYPVTRTTEVPVPQPEQSSEMPPSLSTSPESAQSPMQSDLAFYIAKPTILAFFAPVSPILPKKDAADSNEALSDFQFYGRQVLKPLAKIGVDYKEIYASRFVVRLGDTPTTFRPAKGVGYYFVAPGKKPCVEYGVMTDSDLLHAAHNCFGLE